MGLFKPRWQSNNLRKALESVEKQTDQTILAEIVKKAMVDNVRMLAVKKLTDQSILSSIVRDAESKGDRALALEAAKRITDQSILGDICKRSYHVSEVSEFCFNSISNDDVLVDIIVNDTQGSYSAKALSKVVDERSIFIAGKKLINQAKIKSKNKERWASDLSRNAIFNAIWERISNQDMLAELFICTEGKIDTGYIDKKITDTNIIMRLYSNGIYSESLVKLLNDQQLMRIYNDNNKAGDFGGWSIRVIVARYVKEMSEIITIARDDKDDRVRNEAIKRISDEDGLLQILFNDEGNQASVNLLERLLNKQAVSQPELRELATHAKASSVRRKACEAIGVHKFNKCTCEICGYTQHTFVEVGSSAERDSGSVAHWDVWLECTTCGETDTIDQWRYTDG